MNSWIREGALGEESRSAGKGDIMTSRYVATIGILSLLVAGGCLSSSPRPQAPGDWLITVYYTAVESFHQGMPGPVYGCAESDCASGNVLLGSYPVGFADRVRDEGTGRITSGPQTGRYLNWSHDVGYWLADIPMDSRGQALEPFVSAAADSAALAMGTNFTIVDCGAGLSGEAPPGEVCRRMRSARWQIRDEFTPGLGGPGHIDLYIGEEQVPDFTSSPWYISLKKVSIKTG